MMDDVMRIDYSLVSMFPGAKVFPFYTVDSTNKVAKELAARMVPEGSLIISETQTAGKGRLGRSWYSPPYKGLWFSMILYPSIFPQDIGKITIAAGVSVMRTVRKFGIDVWLKWPNDLMVGSKKLCGILVETGIEYDIVNYVVVGIGINVNHSEEDIPDELSDVMTSMKMIKGKEFLRAIVLSEVVGQIKGFYPHLKNRRFHTIREIWEEESGFVGRSIEVVVGDSKVSGIVAGLSDDGGLLLKGEDGLIREIWIGEVSKVKAV